MTSTGSVQIDHDHLRSRPARSVRVALSRDNARGRCAERSRPASSPKPTRANAISSPERATVSHVGDACRQARGRRPLGDGVGVEVRGMTTCAGRHAPSRHDRVAERTAFVRCPTNGVATTSLRRSSSDRGRRPRWSPVRTLKALPEVLAGKTHRSHIPSSIVREVDEGQHRRAGGSYAATRPCRQNPSRRSPWAASKPVHVEPVTATSTPSSSNRKSIDPMAPDPVRTSEPTSAEAGPR